MDMRRVIISNRVQTHGRLMYLNQEFYLGHASTNNHFTTHEQYKLVRFVIFKSGPEVQFVTRSSSRRRTIRSRTTDLVSLRYRLNIYFSFYYKKNVYIFFYIVTQEFKTFVQLPDQIFETASIYSYVFIQFLHWENGLPKYVFKFTKKIGFIRG